MDPGAGAAEAAAAALAQQAGGAVPDVHVGEAGAGGGLGAVAGLGAGAEVDPRPLANPNIKCVNFVRDAEDGTRADRARKTWDY